DTDWARMLKDADAGRFDGDHDVEPPGVGVLEHPRPVRVGTTRLGGRDGGVLVLGDDPPAPPLGQVADLAALGVDGPSVAGAVLGDPHVGGSSYGHGANVTDECSDTRTRCTWPRRPRHSTTSPTAGWRWASHAAPPRRPTAAGSPSATPAPPTRAARTSPWRSSRPSCRPSRDTR